MPHTSPTARGQVARLLLTLLVCCVLTLACMAQATGATDRAGGYSQAAALGAGGSAPTDSGTLEQCVSVGEQAERSATFSGEMTAITGAARMAMRIEVQERMPGEELFHTVSAPGLGVWRGSDPGVKIYKYVRQVTNLSSPAIYRALVRFHWLDEGGHVIRRAERRTPKCEQPTPAVTPAPPTSSSSLE